MSGSWWNNSISRLDNSISCRCLEVGEIILFPVWMLSLRGLSRNWDTGLIQLTLLYPGWPIRCQYFTIYNTSFWLASLDIWNTGFWLVSLAYKYQARPEKTSVACRPHTWKELPRSKCLPAHQPANPPAWAASQPGSKPASQLASQQAQPARQPEEKSEQ